MSIIQTIEKLQTELNCVDVTFVYKAEGPDQTGRMIPEGRAVVTAQRIFSANPDHPPTEAKIVKVGTDYGKLLDQVLEVATHFSDLSAKAPVNVVKMGS